VTLFDWYARHESVLRPALRIGPIFGGVALLAWRVHETRVPVTPRSIVIPPLAMSTGFGMFVAPMMRVPWWWAVTSLVFGVVVLSWPLLRSSRLELREGVVHMRRSRAFLWILLGLLSVRLLLHDYIGHLVSPLQTAALFYLMAFGMIVRWRAALFVGYRRLTSGSPPASGPARSGIV